MSRWSIAADASPGPIVADLEKLVERAESDERILVAIEAGARELSYDPRARELSQT